MGIDSTFRRALDFNQCNELDWTAISQPFSIQGIQVFSPSPGQKLTSCQQIQAGLFEDAVSSFKKSISNDVRNVQALYELGRTLV